MGADTIDPEAQRALRDRVRVRRRALPARERQASATAVAGHLMAAEIFVRARCVLAYLAIDGELDLKPVIERAWSGNKRVCLPVVAGAHGSILKFHPYTPETELTVNRFGIQEPPSDSSRCPADALDLVLCPLVAFDDRGTRVGMGGGYYDATFRAKLDSPAQRPTLLGIAYDAQRVEPILDRKEWDVPLDGVVTESGIRWFTGGAGN